MTENKSMEYVELSYQAHSRPITQEYANELKKKVYYLGKDLLRAEKEMLRMQCQISGVLQGVERDFR